LRNQGVEVAPLLASNCGFDLEPGWSPFFVERHAGQPFKSVALRVMDGSELLFQRQGEFVATETGVEGSLVYAASSVLRDLVLRQGHATAWLDLLPHWPLDKVVRELSVPRGARSFSTHLKSRLGLSGIKAAVLYESWSPSAGHDPVEWAHRIKAVPLRLARTRPLDEAISSAGGVAWEALDAACMLRALPGVYCAGEMLDWEAPTGGYLLTACLALGPWVGRAVDEQLRRGL
jgi:uncharacterized flavoprotein (TIGR03862 family)